MASPTLNACLFVVIAHLAIGLCLFAIVTVQRLFEGNRGSSGDRH